MRKTTPAVEEITCDFTGKKNIRRTPNYLGGEFSFDLMFLDLNDFEYMKQECKETGGDIDEVKYSCYGEKSMTFDMSEEVAMEVFKFLMRKYPDKMKKKFAGYKLVKSNWEDNK